MFCRKVEIGVMQVRESSRALEGQDEKGNVMKQIIIRMIVVLTMCAGTSVIRFTSFIVISRGLQVHAGTVWILRLILASILSPLLYSFLEKLTAGWAIRARHKSHRASNQSMLSIRPSALDESIESHFSSPDLSRSR